MTHINKKQPIVQDEQIKFLLPQELKASLLKLARERNINLSSLMRLIATDYLKRNLPV